MQKKRKVSLTGFVLPDRWRTLHTNVLQAGVTDSACQYYKLLRVTTSTVKVGCGDQRESLTGEEGGVKVHLQSDSYSF